MAVKLALIDVWRVAACDQRIRICGVADDQDANIATCMVVDRLALDRKYLCIRLQEVVAFHAGPARPSSDEQRVITVFEGHVRVICCHNAGERDERTVIEFHDNALESGQRGRYLEQLQNDGLIVAEHLPGGDAKGELVADLAGGAGDRYANGWLHWFVS